MSIVWFDNFNLRTKIPIDNRYVCNVLNDITLAYDGLVTFQLSDKSFYRRIDGVWKKDSFELIDSFNTSINNLNLAVYNDRIYNEKNSNNHVLGIEYLNYYHNKVRANVGVKLVFSGDSTTYGTSINDENFKLHNLAKSFLESNGVLQVASINAGHESMNSGTWISTFLDQDLAQNPDLYVLRWGFNWYGTLENRLEVYLNDLRVGLAKIRASKNANQMSIVLCSPNSGDDSVNHRDAEWFDKIHPYLIQIARDYQCCFADVYHYMYDAHNVTWQDEYLYSGIPTHVHPLETANTNIVSLLAEPLIPTATRKGKVINQVSTTGLKSVTDAPSTYPFGVSIYRGTGFPLDGFVYNIMSADGIAFQINSSYQGAVNAYAIRRGMRNVGVAGSIGDDAWGAWISHGVSESPQNLTLQNSWVAYGAPYRAPQYFKDGSGIVHLQGMVKLGTATAGTIIATLPTGYRMSASAFITIQTGTGAGMLLIDASGNIKIQNVSSNDWLNLENIHFRAEQ